MSFIQWAVLTVIGIFTLTFCTFTILDRVLKYRENKNNRQNVDFCMDKMNEKYELLNNNINIIDMAHEQRFINIHEEINKLREEMRDILNTEFEEDSK